MDWLRSLILPPQGSAFAGEVDSLYMFLTWLTVFFFLLILGVIVYSVIKFRHKPGDVTPHWTHNNKLEFIWTAVPTVIVIIIFFWGVKGYVEAEVAPGNAEEIQITAKKWVWQFESPDGTRAINEVHVQLNRPVKFLASSEDVIHDFFVPDMRVKHDILPDRYVQIWFTPTVPGKHHFTCAEYCGRGHSDMMGTLYVDTPAEYEKWPQRVVSIPICRSTNSGFSYTTPRDVPPAIPSTALRAGALLEGRLRAPGLPVQWTNGVGR